MNDSLAGVVSPVLPPAVGSSAAPPFPPSQLPRVPSQLPRVASPVLRRSRLEQRLDEPAAVTLLEGGAGYGKTTLLADWLGQQPADGTTVVWVTAAEELDHLDRFWPYLGRKFAAAGVAIAPHNEPRAAIDEALLVQPDGWRAVVVLDDFDGVRDTRILWGLIDLTRLHRSVRVVVASRGRHPIADRAAAAVDVALITPSELLLDDEETLALASVVGKEVTVAQARELRQATGGWVAVARTVLETARPGEPLPAALDRCLDLHLASDVGPRDALGWLLVDSRGHSQPTALADLHARVARWYLARGGPGDALAALDHAAVSRDSQLVVDVWARHGATLIPAAPHRLSAVLSALPGDVLSSRPALRVAHQSATILADASGPHSGMASLRAYAESSASILGEGIATDSDAEALYLETGRMVAYRLRGELERAITLAARLDARFTPREAPVGGLRDWLAWFHLQQGQTLLLAGDDRAATEAWERAWLLSCQLPDRALPAYVVALLALAHALAGRIEPARQWLGEYRAIADGGAGPSRLGRTAAHLASGWLALDQLDQVATLRELEWLGPRSGPSELSPLLTVLDAQYALHFGDPARAVERLDAAGTGSPAGADPGALGVLLDRARADLQIACGQLGEARQLLRRQHAAHTTLRVPVARLHLLAGEYLAVRSGGRRDAWDHELSARDRVELLLIQAVAALRDGEAATAASLARQALELHRANPVLRPWATLIGVERENLLVLAGGRLGLEATARLDEQTPMYAGPPAFVELTRRERVVLTALAKTSSRRDLANELYVSVNTVKVQLGSLYRKLGVSSRDAALVKARELGLIDADG